MCLYTHAPPVHPTPRPTEPVCRGQRPWAKPTDMTNMGENCTINKRNTTHVQA